MKIVLASASPRRKELLCRIASDFEVVPFSGEEKLPLSRPSRYVVGLARLKAEGVARVRPDALIVGADTVVVHRGKILGKPSDKEDALAMLRSLSGRSHSVYTGVCVLAAGRETVFWVRSRVRFFRLTDDSIRAYIETGSPMDKAGAYGIQDSGFVKKIRGSYTNVMGLPVEKLEKTLNREEKNG